MRTLQLIDTLRPGGAERMAVIYANELAAKIEASYICCTRRKGLLETALQPGVRLLFLRKKSTVDLLALRKLRRFIEQEKIDIVHAHSSSFFIAALLKLTGGTFKLVWHDHYGNSDFLEKRKFKVLKLFSPTFDGIISVNNSLKQWAEQELACKKVVKINNFIPEVSSKKVQLQKLQGEPDSFKIICVANLRPQKDLLTLISAFEKLRTGFKSSLHLVGENPKTSYSQSVLNKIDDSPRKRDIFYYGSQASVFSLLLNADLGVLSSVSEGLPLALLEYGMAGLPVISTEVGECTEVVGDTGKLVTPGDADALAKEMNFYLENKKLRLQDAKKFHQRIEEHYSSKKILQEVLNFYREVIK